jgi:hypothetical protein
MDGNDPADDITVLCEITTTTTGSTVLQSGAATTTGMGEFVKELNPPSGTNSWGCGTRYVKLKIGGSYVSFVVQGHGGPAVYSSPIKTDSSECGS